MVRSWIHGSGRRRLSGETDKLCPRDRSAADPPSLRAGAVRLPDQPLPQPRARQHLVAGDGRRRLLPHPVLAISTRCHHLLCLGARALGSRILGAVPAPAVQLEGDRTAAARARFKYPRACRSACGRRAARPVAVRAGEALSAGALFVLGRAAIQDMADVRGRDHCLGSWLHRPSLLAADEGVRKSRRAVPACCRGAGPDLGAARLLPERAKRHSPQSRFGVAGEQPFAAKRRDPGPADDAGTDHR